MEIFLTLFYKIIPLYIIIFLGFLASKHLQVAKESFGKILIYMISPAVVFYVTATSKITLSTLILPLFFFSIASILAFIFLQIGKKIWHKNTTANIFAFSAGTGNSGYFGFPVALALFGEPGLSLAVPMSLGLSLFENSVGCYLTARGQFTGADSLKKVFRIPMLYAFMAGILFSLSEINLGETISTTLSSFKGAYSVLGMMIIGMSVANLENFSLDYKFIGLTFIAKFLVWPVIIFSFVFLDKNLWNFFSPLAHQIMILMSIVPLAANTVVFATEFKVYPEKMATAVLLSTIVALFYIPTVLSLFNF